MANWYVRPDTSHGSTRDGGSYDTAWGAWSEIVWGGAGVIAGDTLYVCGVHSASSQLNIGVHGGTVSSRVTISGAYAPDPGSIVYADGSVFLLVNRDYTTISNLTITAGTLYGLYLYGGVTGITIQGNTLNGGTGQPIINISGGNGFNYTDLAIEDNDFIGGSGAAFGSAVNWSVFASGSPLSTLNRVNITNNRFTGCSSTRAVIDLWIQDEANAASNMADVIVSGNTFIDCYAVAMEIYAGVYGRNTGIRLTDNVISNQQAVGVIGGGMSIGGFGPSLTDGFGSNVIARNEGYVLHGPTGMINVFYGTYRIFDNYAEDLTTDTIDGAGILFDHDTRDCVAYGNHFRRLRGKPEIYYSGNGLTVLDSTTVKAYGNLVEDAYCGIHFGNKLTGQSSDLHNNTLVRCAMAVDMLSTANKTDNLVRNSIFTASGAVPSVRVSGGGWTGESSNCFHGFSSISEHTLAETSLTDDPQLDDNCRPQVRIPAASYLPGKDFYGRPLPVDPIIGATVELPSYYNVSLSRL